MFADLSEKTNEVLQQILQAEPQFKDIVPRLAADEALVSKLVAEMVPFLIKTQHEDRRLWMFLQHVQRGISSARSLVADTTLQYLDLNADHSASHFQLSFLIGCKTIGPSHIEKLAAYVSRTPGGYDDFQIMIRNFKMIVSILNGVEAQDAVRATLGGNTLVQSRLGLLDGRLTEKMMDEFEQNIYLTWLHSQRKTMCSADSDVLERCFYNCNVQHELFSCNLSKVFPGIAALSPNTHGYLFPRQLSVLLSNGLLPTRAQLEKLFDYFLARRRNTPAREALLSVLKILSDQFQSSADAASLLSFVFDIIVSQSAQIEVFKLQAQIFQAFGAPSGQRFLLDLIEQRPAEDAPGRHFLLTGLKTEQLAAQHRKYIAEQTLEDLGDIITVERHAELRLRLQLEFPRWLLAKLPACQASTRLVQQVLKSKEFKPVAVFPEEDFDDDQFLLPFLDQTGVFQLLMAARRHYTGQFTHIFNAFDRVCISGQKAAIFHNYMERVSQHITLRVDLHAATCNVALVIGRLSAELNCLPSFSQISGDLPNEPISSARLATLLNDPQHMFETLKFSPFLAAISWHHEDPEIFFANITRFERSLQRLTAFMGQRPESEDSDPTPDLTPLRSTVENLLIRFQAESETVALEIVPSLDTCEHLSESDPAAQLILGIALQFQRVYALCLSGQPLPAPCRQLHKEKLLPYLDEFTAWLCTLNAIPTKEFFLKTLAPTYSDMRVAGLPLKCMKLVKHGIENGLFSSRRKTQIVQSIVETVRDKEMDELVAREYQRIVATPGNEAVNLQVVNLAETIPEMHTLKTLFKVLAKLDGDWASNNSWNGIIQRYQCFDKKTRIFLSDSELEELTGLTGLGPRGELMRFLVLNQLDFDYNSTKTRISVREFCTAKAAEMVALDRPEAFGSYCYQQFRLVGAQIVKRLDSFIKGFPLE